MRQRDLRASALWALDIAVAVGVGVTSAVTLDSPSRNLSALSYLLLLGHTLPVALRRRWPLPVLATCLVTGALLPLTGVPPFITGPLVLLPLYSTAATYPLRVALVGLLGAEAVLGLQGLDFGGSVTWGLILGGAWLLGHFARTRRLYTSALERSVAELEQARDELARRAVTDERLRIARELHDVVAHAMSVIAVQSGVGAHVIDTQPAEAKKALAAIETASRDALTEMRRLLGVLRNDSDDGMALAPAPGLADLGALVDRVAEAGVKVGVTQEGTDVAVPPGIDLAAYRIVQEALTNVVKHARADHARVNIQRTDAEVSIEVSDDGVGATSTNGAGHGIAGMRERASLYGGTIDVGPGPGGGFRVLAKLPLRSHT